jgi:hypothetical protein
MTIGRILHASDGRVCGRVVGAVFLKTVSAARHMLVKPPAWAIDAGALREAQEAGATEVVIHDLDTAAAYQAPIETVLRHGFALNRGYGQQIALPLALWRKCDAKAERQQPALPLELVG